MLGDYVILGMWVIFLWFYCFIVFFWKVDFMFYIGKSRAQKQKKGVWRTFCRFKVMSYLGQLVITGQQFDFAYYTLELHTQQFLIVQVSQYEYIVPVFIVLLQILTESNMGIVLPVSWLFQIYGKALFGNLEQKAREGISVLKVLYLRFLFS